MKHSEWLLNCLLISRLSLSWTNCNTFFCILTSNINYYFYFIFKACICNNDKQNLYIMIWHRYIYIFFDEWYDIDINYCGNGFTHDIDINYCGNGFTYASIVFLGSCTIIFSILSCKIFLNLVHLLVECANELCHYTSFFLKTFLAMAPCVYLSI